MSGFFDRLGSELERAISSDTARSRRSLPGVAVAFGAAVFLLVVIGAALLLVRPFSGEDPFTPVTQLSETPIDPAGPLSGAVNEVWSVAAAKDGSLWAATGGGIVHWDVATETPTVYTTADGVPTNHAFRIAVAPDGSVWTGDSGWVARFDSSWEVFAAPPGVDGPAMTVDSDGTLWGVGGENQLYRFDGSEWQVAEVPDLSGVGEWSPSLAAAQDGTIWAATNMRKGLLSFDGEEWMNHTDELPNGFALNVAVAPGGAVWVGSESDARGSGPGVARLDEDGWTVFTTADGLSSSHALVAVGSDGTVWAAHSADGVGGVSRFDGEKWIAYPDVGGSGLGLAVDRNGTLWMPSPQGLVGFDGERTTHLVVPVTPPSTATSAAPIEGWDPILATTRAKTVPQAATCPAGTDPNLPGSADRSRPEAGYVRNDAATFDPVRGRVVYADALGATWAFDVCTNTWSALDPGGVLAGDAWGGLVYDVDSDRLIALGLDVSVYDPTSNSWAQVTPAGDDVLDYWPVGGGVWDPVSGLVVVEHMGIVKAYDVDADVWTAVGGLREDVGQMLGYTGELDRLIFTGGPGRLTLLVDPRNGAITELEAETPPMVGGFGSLLYTSGSDGAYVATQSGGVCWFDAVALDWECSQPSQSNIARTANALEHDPINRRLLAIGFSSGGWDGPEVHSDAVWALDLETGEWTEIVATTRP